MHTIWDWFSAKPESDVVEYPVPTGWSINKIFAKLLQAYGFDSKTNEPFWFSVMIFGPIPPNAPIKEEQPCPPFIQTIVLEGVVLFLSKNLLFNLLYVMLLECWKWFY